MKFVWGVLVLLIGLAMPQVSQAQTSVYGEFSATELHNLVSRDFLYGVTTGLLFDGPTFHHVIIGADIQGRFMSGNGERFDSATAGPRFTIPMHHFSPYGEFLVGFARFNGNAATAIYNGTTGTNSSTDSTIQINGGISKELSAHLDGVVEYSYAQFYGYGGQYNPKTFSIGARYYFTGRQAQQAHAKHSKHKK